MSYDIMRARFWLDHSQPMSEIDNLTMDDIAVLVGYLHETSLLKEKKKMNPTN